MKAAKIESCRDDGHITIEVELTSGREAGIVMPRNPTDQEVREIAVAVAVEAHVDKHSSDQCATIKNAVSLARDLDENTKAWVTEAMVAR